MHWKLKEIVEPKLYFLGFALYELPRTVAKLSKLTFIFYWTVAAHTCKRVSNYKLTKGTGKSFWALAFHCCIHKAVPELNVWDKCFGAQKQTKTKEREVEIGFVSKAGGGSASDVQGHPKPKHASAQQSQQGHKFSTHWESISQGEGRTWKEAYRRNTKILHLVLLDLEHCKLGDPVRKSFSRAWHKNLCPAEKQRLLWRLP